MSRLADHPVRAPGWRAGFAAYMLRRLLTSRLACGSLTVRTPEGLRAANPGSGSGPQADLILHRWRALRRLLWRGDLGFAEAYMDGDWDSPNLVAVIELAARNEDMTAKHGAGTFFSRLVSRIAHAARANTKRRARRNIQAHYDLGNEFYAAWLDPGMTYSSGLYTERCASLEDAQVAKQDRVIELLQAAPGARVLEIGCGWGGMAERLARESNVSVTGVTLSQRQADYARMRLADLPAEIALRDYREERGVYDRIVSIEMLEAVGAAYWRDFFSILKQRLVPGGRAVLQVITIAEERFENYLHQPDFIQHYIFPGGMLPTIEIMRREIGGAGMQLVSLERFGASYAATLAEWHRRFELSWERLRAQGFDAHFRRKWIYYLQYCEAGFRTGAIDVGLYTIENS
jgi:cyclopropane-fatty-acyl-phospholipid synthase